MRTPQHRDATGELDADLIGDADLDGTAASPEKLAGSAAPSKFTELSNKTATILAAFKVRPVACGSGYQSAHRRRVLGLQPAQPPDPFQRQAVN